MLGWKNKQQNYGPITETNHGLNMSKIGSDVIIISWAKNQKLKNITESCINSLRASEDIDFNIIVVETNKNVKYNDCFIIRPPMPFNYNHCVNLGLSLCHHNVITFCNNDIIFHSGWLTSHLEVFSEHKDIFSLCSKCPSHKLHSGMSGLNRGFEVRRELVGWCITCRREVFEIIGKLNEDVRFWYSDNVYANQLKLYSLQHALNSNSLVTHLFSSTLVTSDDLDDLTVGQKFKYISTFKVFL